MRGADEDQVVYADDTILLTQSLVAMGRLLEGVEREGARHGLWLNRGKCECVTFGFVGGVSRGRQR